MSAAVGVASCAGVGVAGGAGVGVTLSTSTSAMLNAAFLLLKAASSASAVCFCGTITRFASFQISNLTKNFESAICAEFAAYLAVFRIHGEF